MNREYEDESIDSRDDGKRKIEERGRLRHAIGRRIAAARHRQGLTQNELAERLDVRGWMINRYERGRSAPRLEVIVRLRSALEVSLDYLLAGMNEPEPPHGLPAAEPATGSSPEPPRRPA
jgi:transcriptional regulator with XRE-family HTH domain